ncbi:hypothetical protein FMEXI_135 [Fusarium mexicanum]|uniref:Uncharacterized protein n=1 Tax=Fusarium mexicanum TaxID=751941 RepID=A0A8H5NBR2_9HYPO|nr:hypothetical protein FMEXI_135 [Fusarium mexicanum]
MDATINGAFEALDGIHFDFQPFTVQEALREDSATLERRKFSWEAPPTSSHQAIASDTLASDEKSQLYICSPSSVASKTHDQLHSILPEDITGTFVNNRESLDQRVHLWLVELPDIPWLDALEESSEDEASSTTDTEQPRESIPGTEGLLNYLDFLGTCYESIQPTSPTRGYVDPTRGYVDYGKPDLDAATDLATGLDAYHLTLLQMDSSSAFATNVDGKFRPSMRRRYPRGLEKEARKRAITAAFFTKVADLED